MYLCISKPTSISQNAFETTFKRISILIQTHFGFYKAGSEMPPLIRSDVLAISCKNFQSPSIKVKLLASGSEQQRNYLALVTITKHSKHFLNSRKFRNQARILMIMIFRAN